MARRNRRRRRFTWFPNLGIDTFGDANPETRLSGVNFSLAAAQPGDRFARAILPLTFDQPRNEAVEAATNPALSLSALQGSAWFLRRVVGSIQIARGFLNTAPELVPIQPALIVGAALAVIPWDEYSNTPEADVNPLLQADINEPWLWRKTCILGAQVINPAATTNIAANALRTFPVNTSFYPQSRFETVDQKTMRIISGDERLCLVVSCAVLTSAPFTENTDGIFGYLDYRLLGALRRRTNRGGTVN